MIDVFQEEVIELAAARKLLPSRPDRATLYRWALGNGSHGVRLETVKSGRKRFTSKQAIQRFLEAVTAASDGQIAPAIRTSRQRQKDIQAAAQRLANAGL